MDLNDLKARFNLQKLAEEFKAVIDDKPAIHLDDNNPIGHGLKELLTLIQQMNQLQKEQLKIMDQLTSVIGAMTQQVPNSTSRQDTTTEATDAANITTQNTQNTDDTKNI